MNKFLRTLSNFFSEKKIPNLSKASDGITEELTIEYNSRRKQFNNSSACYAPYRSIYFGHHGRLAVCCYNRQFILGTYPEESIKEIWFGENTKKLRDALANYDFSYGCKGCLAHLVAENFDAVKSKQYDLHRQNPNGYPSVMEFELENLCNLECTMCNGDFSSLIRANREKREPLVSPYDNTFIEQLKEFIPYLEDVKFYGGEPFLIETYYKIWELIMEINPNVRIQVQTNATILNNRVKSILNKTNFHINISLDSLQKETYESIRVNAKFERVMENVKWYINYCREKNTFIGISACAMRNNWKEIPDMISFCNERDIQVYFHTVFYPLNLAIRTLKPSELKEILDYLRPILPSLPEESNVHNKNKRHFKDIINQIENWITINESLVSINSFHDFKGLIKNKLKEEYFLEKFDLARTKLLLEKLTLLDSEMPGEFKSGDIYSRVDLSNDMAIEEFLISIETQDMSELKEKAKNFYSIKD